MGKPKQPKTPEEKKKINDKRRKTIEDKKNRTFKRIQKLRETKRKLTRFRQLQMIPDIAEVGTQTDDLSQVNNSRVHGTSNSNEDVQIVGMARNRTRIVVANRNNNSAIRETSNTNDSDVQILDKEAPVTFGAQNRVNGLVVQTATNVARVQPMAITADQPLTYIAIPVSDYTAHQSSNSEIFNLQYELRSLKNKLRDETEKKQQLCRELRNLKRKKTGIKIKHHLKSYFELSREAKIDVMNDLKQVVQERFKNFPEDEVSQVLSDAYPHLRGIKTYSARETFEYQNALHMSWNSMDKARQMHSALGHNPFAPKNQVLAYRRELEAKKSGLQQPEQSVGTCPVQNPPSSNSEVQVLTSSSDVIEENLSSSQVQNPPVLYEIEE
uniref:Uncharacterized protein n=1 Tax=Panagrolaimus sp. JU765 TaxID=591449 RepID=A0AC34QZE4_9BILA